MKKAVILFICCLACLYVHGQNKRALDSLMNIYKTTKYDTVKIFTLGNIAIQYRGSKPDTCIMLAQKALEQSEKNNFQLGKASSLSTIGTVYQSQANYTVALAYYQKSLQIFTESKNKKGIANILGNIGLVYKDQSNYPLALEYYQKSLKMHEDGKNKLGIANALNNIGFIYRIQGNVPLALEHYQKSLRIYEEIKDRRGIANSLNNIGVVYYNAKNNPLALEYYQKTLKIQEELKDKHGIANSLNNIGNVYRDQDDLPLALEQYEKALKIREEIKNKLGIANSLFTISSIYQIQENYQKSTEYAEKSLQLYQEIKALNDMKEVMYTLYRTYKLQNNTSKALEYFESGRQIQDSLFSLEKSKAISTLTSTMELERKQKAFALLQKDNELNRLNTESIANELKINQKQAEADRLFALATQERDKRKSDSLRTLAQRIQVEADNLRTTARLEADNKRIKEAKDTLEKKKQKETDASNRIIFYLVLASLLGVCVFAVFVYRSRQVQKTMNTALSHKSQALTAKAAELTNAYHELQSTHEELHQSQEEIISQRDFIEEQNKSLAHHNIQVKQSIETALVIQKALLPFDDRISMFLKDYFVFYHPRDIVSGDFYWIEKYEETIYVVAGDCTGHGVPGAFMSLIAINLLERVILQQKETNVVQILRDLHILVRLALKQDLKENHSGMDMGLVAFDYGRQGEAYIRFAGAKRPLYYIDSEKPNAIHKLDASRKSIGGFQNENKDYAEQTLTLPAGSVFYLSSDGLEDQNDMDRKRLREQPILDTLLSNYSSLEAQKEALNRLLENHMKNTKQRDDILLLGVSI